MFCVFLHDHTELAAGPGTVGVVLTTAGPSQHFPCWMVSIAWFGLVWIGLACQPLFFALCATARGHFFQGLLTKEV